MGDRLKQLVTRNRFALFFWIGVVLLILSFGIFSYADSVVRGQEQILQGDVAPSERERISGSLMWWRIAQITLYNPASLVFMVTGVFCVLYACTWAVLQPLRVE